MFSEEIVVLLIVASSHSIIIIIMYYYVTIYSVYHITYVIISACHSFFDVTVCVCVTNGIIVCSRPLTGIMA